MKLNIHLHLWTKFDLNLTSFKLSYASQAPSGPARLRWDKYIFQETEKEGTTKVLYYME